jgi:hypothetical protein
LPADCPAAGVITPDVMNDMAQCIGVCTGAPNATYEGCVISCKEGFLAEGIDISLFDTGGIYEDITGATEEVVEIITGENICPGGIVYEPGDPCYEDPVAIEQGVWEWVCEEYLPSWMC